MNLKNSFILFTGIWLIIFSTCFQVWSKTYEIGPDKEFTDLNSVPFDNLEPGDHVKIHYRSQPYKTIFIIRKSGFKSKPIIIEGVTKNGRRPVIEGDNAVQLQTDFSKQYGRWLIKIGDKNAANFITLKNLHLKNANNLNSFIFKGNRIDYKNNAGGIFIKHGHNIQVENCVITSCGNGIISGYMPYVNNVLIDNCYIFDNGNHKNPKSPYEHNIYIGSGKAIIQFSKIYNPRSGHCIKDRSHKTTIRYNWVEGGKNRQLDLVDHKFYKKADAVVYGNVIVQGKKSRNRNMIHWGGDQKVSRSGILYLFNNTIVGRSRQTDFLVTRHSDCSIQMINNIIEGSGNLWNNVGFLSGSNNWFSNKIQVPSNQVLGIRGFSPGFLPDPRNPYQLGPGSMAINAGTLNIPVRIRYMPNPKKGRLKRPIISNIDIGAFEYLPISHRN